MDDRLDAEFFNYPLPGSPPEKIHVEGRKPARNIHSGRLTSARTKYYRLLKHSQVNGYDVSIIHGLNNIPSYTEYFGLTAATFGINAASVSVGRFSGMLGARAVTNQLDRHPVISWGSVVTLAGVAVQTAAQNVVMFVLGCVVFGFGSAISGTAFSAYFSGALAEHWYTYDTGKMTTSY